MAGLEIGLGIGARGPQRARVDLAGGALPPGAQFTRASAARYRTADGRLALAPADAPRFDHDGPRALLIEPAATNLVPWSSDFAAPIWATDAAWGGTAPVIAPAAAPGPDGINPAMRIDFDRGEGFSRLFASVATQAPGLHCLSLWLRSDTPGASIALRIDGVAGATVMLGTGWTRHWIAAPVAEAAVCQLILWNIIDGAPATASVLAWGMQLEAGGAPSSTIDTAGIPATRAADRMMLAAAPLGLADGPAALRLVFDDGSSAARSVAVEAGMIAVPADLPRHRLAAIEPA